MRTAPPSRRHGSQPQPTHRVVLNGSASTATRTRDNGGVHTTRVTRADIEAAAERLDGVATTAPLQLNARLSARPARPSTSSARTCSRCASYKLRGAYNLMAQLDERRAVAGVVCASAGNHAQGVALSCQLLGITARSTCRAPRRARSVTGSPSSAAAASTIELVGDTYDDASPAAAGHAAARRRCSIPAFDDPRTIAGQGTVVSEIASSSAAARRPGDPGRRRGAARRDCRLAGRAAVARSAGRGLSRPARRACAPR